jgi:hypothetical protein
LFFLRKLPQKSIRKNWSPKRQIWSIFTRQRFSTPDSYLKGGNWVERQKLCCQVSREKKPKPNAMAATAIFNAIYPTWITAGIFL